MLGRRLRQDDRGQISGRLDLMAIMVTVIAAGVTGYVGLNVMTTTRDQAGINDNSSVFWDAQSNLTTGVTSFFSGLGTVFTVVILVVILSYLMLLRGR